jgi:outer membrane protein assembly factor BamB
MAPVNVPYYSPQVRDGRIYVWTTAPVTATRKTTFDVATGEVTREASAAVAGENRLVIVDEETGMILVDRPMAPYGPEFEAHQEPKRGTLCKNHIVFTTKTGLIAVFRLSDGALVWKTTYEDELMYPVFDENRLYVACANGSLVVFEAEGGEL